MTLSRLDAVEDVMETIIRAHMGSTSFTSVAHAPHYDGDEEAISVDIEVAQDMDSDVKERAFSLTRVLREHLLSNGEERFPVVNLRKARTLLL